MILNDSRQRSLFIETDIFFFNEDVMIGEDKRTTASTLSGQSELGAYPPERFKLFHRQEGYYSLNDHSAVLRTEQGLRIHFSDSIAANIEADYRVSRVPEAGKRNADLSMILGLTYVYADW